MHFLREMELENGGKVGLRRINHQIPANVTARRKHSRCNLLMANAGDCYQEITLGVKRKQLIVSQISLEPNSDPRWVSSIIFPRRRVLMTSFLIIGG